MNRIIRLPDSFVHCSTMFPEDMYKTSGAQQILVAARYYLKESSIQLQRGGKQVERKDVECRASTSDRHFVRSWNVGEPNNVGDEDCVEVLQGGGWNDHSCSVSRPYICERSVGTCPAGWLTNERSCYQFNTNHQTQWLEAKLNCEAVGAQLITISSQAEQDFINTMSPSLQAGGTNYLWTGLSDYVDDGVFHWPDDDVTYTNWLPSNPSDRPDYVDCTTIYTGDNEGHWETRECFEQHAYICELPQGKDLVTGECNKPLGMESYAIADAQLNASAALDVDHRPQRARLNARNDANGGGGWAAALSDVNEWLEIEKRRTWSRKSPSQKIFQGNTDQNTEVHTYLDTPIVTRFVRIWPKTWHNGIGLRLELLGCNSRQSKSCPSGWTLHPIFSSCYLFVNQEETWDKAQTECDQKNATLTSVTSAEEQDFILSHVNRNLNIGFNDKATEGTFTWLDGLSTTFVNWEPGEPSNAGGNEDCTEIVYDTGLWNDVPCGQVWSTRAYVCKRPADDVSLLPTALPTIAWNSGKCPVGWKEDPMGDFCYQINSASFLTWREAQAMCGQRGGDLLSITTPHEQFYITGPDGDSTNNCVEAVTSNGRWNDVSCDENRGYICKTRQTPTVPTPLPPPDQFLVHICERQGDTLSCDAGKVIEVVAATYGRRDPNICSNNPISNTDCAAAGVMQKVKTSCDGQSSCPVVASNSVFGDPCSGVQKYLEVTYNCVNAGGAVFAAHLAVLTHRQRLKGQGCTLMYGDWTAHSSFLFQSDGVLSCPPGWTSYHDNCFLTSSDQRSWQDASSACRQMGGDLASISTATEQALLTSLLAGGWVGLEQGAFCYQYKSGVKATWMEAVDVCRALGASLCSIHSNAELNYIAGNVGPSGEAYWIGLNNRATNQGYQWSDGTPVGFTDWAPGEPNNVNGLENCVEMYQEPAGAVQWNDVSCYSLRDYVCKIAKGQSPIVQPTSATAPPVVTCEDPSWLYFQDSCYLFVDYFNGRSWDGARQDCRWSDQTPVSFFNWGQGEPNDHNGEQQCGAMYLHNGQWDDDNCGMQHNYICEKANGTMTAAPPTAPWSGNCMSGWSSYGNKCFKIFDEQKTWTAARDVCRGVGPGMDLAAIENEFEQGSSLPLQTTPASNCPSGYTQYLQSCYKVTDTKGTWEEENVACQLEGGQLSSILNVYQQAFVMSLAKGRVWIGLSDSQTPQQYRWTDGWPVLYVNWGANEPSMGPREGCVAMEEGGAWDDTTCSTQLPAVCKISNTGYLQTITFPSPRSVSNYAELGTTLSQDLRLFTLCLQMRTDMSSNSQAGMVSYAVQQQHNELLIFNQGGNGFTLHVQGKTAALGDLSVWDNERHAVCATWRSTDGSWQVYTDGVLKASGSGLNVGGTVRSGGTWILAQDQDAVGGAFHPDQAFSGELSQVNLWDRVLTPAEIGTDWSVFCGQHGNVIDWTTTNINVFGLATSDQYRCYLPPTAPPSHPGRCPDLTWVLWGRKCYYVESGTDTNNRRSWPEADYECTGRGAELVSLHSQAEIGLLQQMQLTSSVWIGLYKNSDRAIEWTDGSPVDYTNWASGEPNDFDGSGRENCVEMYADGRWNDINCFGRLGFVCETSLQITSNTVEPPATTIHLTSIAASTTTRSSSTITTVITTKMPTTHSTQTSSRPMTSTPGVTTSYVPTTWKTGTPTTPPATKPSTNSLLQTSSKTMDASTVAKPPRTENVATDGPSHMTPASQEKDPSAQHDLETGAIVAIILSCVLVLLIAAAVPFFIYRRWSSTRGSRTDVPHSFGNLVYDMGNLGLDNGVGKKGDAVAMEMVSTG
uniref:Macrophage mannose receptor 1-like n=1 Tax=Branchiostoma floridae TaxID=7739 RepID=C3YFR6_BRAFL|eukprot:XP_002604710.1 hypothetical protein BRAFLDRAFT_80319 [Branchiostoma floridae]